MTRRAQKRPPEHWQIKSVPVRAREGTERLRQAYRLLLQPAEQRVVTSFPETCHQQLRRSGGA